MTSALVQSDRFATPTSTGVQTYTFSTLGSKVFAATAQAVWTSSGETDEFSACLGFWADGVANESHSTYSRHGVSPAETGRRTSETFITLLDPTDGSVAAEGLAIFRDEQDKFDINWTTVDTVAHQFQITAYGGDQLEASLVSLDLPVGGRITELIQNRDAVSFTPDLLLLGTCGSQAIDGTSDTDAFLSFGAWTASIQTASCWFSADGDTTQQVTGRTDNTCALGIMTAGSLRSKLEVATTSELHELSFTNTTVNTGRALRATALALRLPGASVSVQNYETRTGGGAGDLSLTTGWTPQHAMFIQSTHLNLNSNYTGAGRTGGISFGWSNSSSVHGFVRGKIRDNQNPSDTATDASTSVAVAIRNESGNNSHDSEARTTFTATGLDFSYNQTPGEVGQNIAVLIEGSPSFPADQNLPAPGLTASPAQGSPAVHPGPVGLPVDGLASPSALGTATLAPGTAPLSVGSLTATASQGIPTLSPGAAGLPAPSLEATAVLGSPELAGGTATLPVPGLTAAAAQGIPTLSPGAAQLTPTGIGASPALGLHELVEGASTVSVGSLTASPALGTATLAPGALELAVGPVLASPAVGLVLLETGSAPLDVGPLTAAASQGTPTLLGQSLISVGPLTATASLGTPSLAFGQDRTVDGLGATAVQGIPTLTNPEPTGSGDFAMVTLNAPSTPGFQDFTAAGKGTPKLVMFVATYATSTQPTADDAGLSVGFSDQSGNQGLLGMTAEDGLGSTDTSLLASGGNVVALNLPGNTSGSAFTTATWDSYIADGVRIEWTSLFFTDVQVTAYMWFGDMETHVGPADLDSGGSPSDTTGVGFEPHMVIAVGSRFSPTSVGVSRAPDGMLTLGVATQVGRSISQQSVGIHWEDAQSTAETVGINSDTFIIQRGGDGIKDVAVELTAFNADGFTTEVVSQDATGGTANVGMLYAAIRFPGNFAYWADLVTLSGATGQTVMPPSFEPTAAFAAGSRVTSLETVDTTDSSGTFFVGGSDGTTSQSYAITCDDGSDPIQAKSHASSAFLRTPDSDDDDGTTGFAANVAFGSLDLTWTQGTPESGQIALMWAWGESVSAIELPALPLTATAALGVPALELGPPPQALDAPGISATPALGTPGLINIAADPPGQSASPALGVPLLTVDPEVSNVKMARATTLRLEAVNTMLSVVGSPPVNSLSDEKPLHVTMAEQILDETIRETQALGWNFNTLRRVRHTPDASKRIVLDSNVIWAVDETRSTNLSARGRYLFDLTGNTFDFESAVSLTLRVCLDWDELPEPARRYIIIRAGRVFQQRLVGSVKLDGFSARDEEQALGALRQFDNTEAQYDIKANPTISQTRRRTP